MTKRLITESEVLRMALPAELVLDGNTLATPAALDAAFRLGIRVVYANRGRPPVRADAAPKAAGGAALPLARLTTLADGDYLVQVRGSGARVFRVEEGGISPLP